MQSQNKEPKQIQTCSLARCNQISQVSFIYSHLIKLGYPKITKLTLTQISQIQPLLNSYFYSTPAREHLIQWLLAIIYPNYRQTEQYKIQNDNISRLVVSLWKIGVLPLSKHTKNLDYHKYVMAMLGYENSVNLIFRMVDLALQMVYLKKSKMDTSFGSFMHEAIDNFSDLINQNYDVYGITFPAMYSDLSSEQFQQKYEQFYRTKIEPLRQKINEPYTAQDNQNDFQSVFQNAARNRQVFNQKYSELVVKIKKMNEKYGHLVNKQQKQPVQKRIQRRTLNISRQFCQKYKKLKKLTGSIKRTLYTDQCKIKKQNIQKLISELNQVNLQNFQLSG